MSPAVFNSCLRSGLAIVALATTALSCSPIAPSVGKSQLVERQGSTPPDSDSTRRAAAGGGDDDSGVPGMPTADIKDVIVYRSSNNAWTFAGADARDWFFLSQPKAISQTELSQSLLTEQFQDFVNKRIAEIPLTMSGLGSASIAALQASVAFEAKIDARVLTPDLLTQLSVAITPGKSGSDGTLYWELAIPSTAPEAVVKPFLAGLTQITVMTSCSTTTGSPAAGNPCGGK